MGPRVLQWREAVLMRLLAIVVACASTCAVARADDDRAVFSRPQPAQPDVVPGELLVKFTEEAAQVLAQVLHESQQERHTGIASIDALIAEHGVVDITPLFPEGEDPTAIDAKFPARAKRARPGAGSVGLSRIYKLSLAPGQSVEAAVEAFALDPHVEYAQPNRLMHTLGGGS